MMNEKGACDWSTPSDWTDGEGCAGFWFGGFDFVSPSTDQEYRRMNERIDKSSHSAANNEGTESGGRGVSSAGTSSPGGLGLLPYLHD